MRLTKVMSVLAMAALPALAMSASLTNSNIDARTTTNVLSFSDLSFDDLSKLRTDQLQFHGAVGDAGKFTIDGPFGAHVVVSVNPGQGMAVSNQAFDPATGSVSYRAAITGTANQTITQSWTVTTSSSLQKGITADGLHYLEFVGNNDGFLKVGGTFDYLVTMPGDWSHEGTATGDSELVGLNSDFTVKKDFVFDAATDTTTLEVLDTRYAVGKPGVGLDFRLFGASTVSAVSEPMAPAMMLAGLAALGLASRRRRVR